MRNQLTRSEWKEAFDILALVGEGSEEKALEVLDKGGFVKPSALDNFNNQFSEIMRESTFNKNEFDILYSLGKKAIEEAKEEKDVGK